MPDLKDIMNRVIPMESFPGLHPSSIQIALAVTLVLGAIQLNSYWKHRTFQRKYGTADYRPLYNPMTALGMLFGLGTDWHWGYRFTMYRKSKMDMISMEPTVWGDPVLYTNSIEVMRQIAGGGTSNAWVKPLWAGVASLYWGNNVLAVNGAEWRKHRRILQPFFNNSTYETVWHETTRLYNEMLLSPNIHWPKKSGASTILPQFLDITHRVALCIILSAGFGLPLRWDQKAYADEKKQDIALDDAIKVQGDNMVLVAYGPKWLFKLPIQKLRKIQAGTAALRTWFNTSILNKKQEIYDVLKETDGDTQSESLKKDVFSRLTLASQQGGKFRLDDSDIIGNTWVMFFAGHDTTSSAIAATLCLLAYHTAEQSIVYDEILSITKRTNGRLSFQSFESLIKTRSAFVEGLRMFPSGHILIRESTEDTVITVPTTGEDGETYEKSVALPKGTVLVGDMVGMQYNPRVFPSPEMYKPSRWYNATTDESYTAFSVGPRVCIGKKFALTESVAFIAHLLRDFSVQPFLQNGEGLEEWRDRVLGRASTKLTLSIIDTPLKFTRR